MTGWTLRSCNIGLHLGVSQSEVICITAYGKFFTGVTPLKYYPMFEEYGHAQTMLPAYKPFSMPYSIQTNTPVLVYKNRHTGPSRKQCSVLSEKHLTKFRDCSPFYIEFPVHYIQLSSCKILPQDRKRRQKLQL